MTGPGSGSWDDMRREQLLGTTEKQENGGDGSLRERGYPRERSWGMVRKRALPGRRGVKGELRSEVVGICAIRELLNQDAAHMDRWSII